MLKYFQAANTSHGFINYFDDAIDKDNASQIIYIKGGSGVGKSTLMRKLSRRAISQGLPVTEICCSSDPTSLDGVVVNDDIAMFDATMPHIQDPTYPMLNSRIVDLAIFLDEDKLKSSHNDIVSLYHIKKSHYKTLYSLLSTLDKNNTTILSLFDIDNDAIHELVMELYRLLKDDKSKDRRGFLSAIDKSGIVSLEDEIVKDENTICISSEYSDISKYVIDKVSKILDMDKISHHRFYDIIDPSIVEILSLSKYHLTHNKVADISITYNIDDMINIKNRHAYDILKTYEKDILSLASSEITLSKDAHHEIENIYQGAMDFDSLTDYTNTLIEKLLP